MLSIPTESCGLQGIGVPRAASSAKCAGLMAGASLVSPGRKGEGRAAMGEILCCANLTMSLPRIGGLMAIKPAGRNLPRQADSSKLELLASW
ncbi:MAG: hypothetical protein DDT26_02752 [Dehalococcoidia bacterium]|nr:hypothetical protein [Chloroflexota bacterium]